MTQDELGTALLSGVGELRVGDVTVQVAVTEVWPAPGLPRDLHGLEFRGVTTGAPKKAGEK